MKAFINYLVQKWKDTRLKIKFAISFGIISLLIIILAAVANLGIFEIVNDTETIIDSAELQSSLEHHYAAHLQWVSSVNRLLTDDNTAELDVETDHTLCDFGNWYYSEDRERAEELVPAIAPILKKFEAPHSQLHASAIEINEIFEQGDRGLSEVITEVKIAHLIWMNNLESSILNGRPNLNIQLDPEECIFGQWLHSEEAKKAKEEYPKVGGWLEEIHRPHELLHNSARAVNNALRNGNVPRAQQIYNSRTNIHAKKVLAKLDEITDWNNQNLNAMAKADSIYNAATLPAIDELSGLFAQLINKTQARIAENNKAIISKEITTRSLLLIISIIVIAFAILAGILFSRFIISNIREEVANAEKIASGDLTDTIKVYNKDELGTLASALEQMRGKLHEIIGSIKTGAQTISLAGNQISEGSQKISEGANEQASSIEEISSSMEETSANTTQTHHNAEKTRDVLKKLSSQVDISSGKGQETRQAMEDITERISIINDISHQTNILALNAAVEAARAGEYGKGFAVVAAEIRKLAERSKEAANEINTFSNKGINTSTETSDMLKELVPLIKNTMEMMDEVVAASAEQSTGAQQVNSAIQELNQVTQENAASAEEMSASAEELDGQSEGLEKLTSYFRVE